MNNSMRKELATIIEKLSKFEMTLECMSKEEMEKFKNLSEGFQMSDNGVQLKESSEALTDAVENIGDVVECIEQAME